MLQSVQNFNCSPDDGLTGISFTKEDVYKMLKSLKQCKAPGPDKIYHRVLKELESEIVEPLFVIFKKSFRQSVIPSDWRRANATPILLSSKCSKLLTLQTIIRGGFTENLYKRSLLNKSQHGFILKMSC